MLYNFLHFQLAKAAELNVVDLASFPEQESWVDDDREMTGVWSSYHCQQRRNDFPLPRLSEGCLHFFLWRPRIALLAKDKIPGLRQRMAKPVRYWTRSFSTWMSKEIQLASDRCMFRQKHRPTTQQSSAATKLPTSLISLTASPHRRKDRKFSNDTWHCQQMTIKAAKTSWKEGHEPTYW